MFNKNVLAILFSAALLALSTGANAKVCTSTAGGGTVGVDMCKGDGVTLSGADNGVDAPDAEDAADAPDVDVVEVDLTPF